MAFDAMGNYIGEIEDTTVYETEEERRKRLEAEAKKRGETVATEEKVIRYEDGSRTVETKREIPAGAVAPSMADRVQQAGQNFINNVQNAPQNFADNLNRGIDNIKQAPENFVNNVQSAVDPAEVFKRMQVIESGNRDFDDKGRPIQSPVGAMYKNQVMPATAANPGFGITPARDNSPEEYNRVGAELFQKLTEKYNGDTQKAAAAYNAGFGRVNQNLARNNGQLNVAQLPKETQGYLQKIGNTISNFIPTAQAAPAQRNVPQAFPEEGVAVATGRGVQGSPSIMGPVSPEQVQQQAQNEVQGLAQYITPGAAAQTPAAMDFVNPDEAAMAADKAQNYLQTQTQAINRYTEAQNDPIALIQLRSDESQPAWVRQSAGTRVAEMITSENNRVAAENALPKMTPAELARVATKKSQGNSVGDWLQYLLFKHVGLNDLANEKGEQLGIGQKWESVTDNDGRNGIVKVSASGRPLEGIKDDGTAMSQAELVSFASGAKKVTKPDVSTQDVEATIDGQIIKGRVVTTYDKNNKPTTKVESGGKYYDYTGAWKPTSIATAAEKAEQASAIKLRYAGPTSYTEAGAKAAGEFNFNNGTNIGYASQQPGAPLIDKNTGKPVQVSSNGVITVTQSGTPGAAAQGGVTTTTPAQGGQTPSQITQQQGVNKVAQEQFVKTTVPAVIEQGNNGRDIATARRQQIAIIENNPSILDIYNGSGDNYDKGRNVITKLLTGVYNENNSGDFYKDVKATGLDTNQRAAIEQMWNLTQGINGKTLKTNTGGGPISNADMRTNQQANLQNFTETTPLGALQVINRSKFQGDLDAAKSAFIAKNPGLTDDVKFNSEWSKESAKYTKAYEGIADARAQFLKPFAPPKDATKEQLSAFRDKVFKSFEMYPVPTFDADTGKWSYGTANAERAAAKKLLGR